MHATAQRVFVFILALWAGSLVTIGYVVAPALFANLSDAQVAGMIAGTLFRVEGSISLIAGVALLVLANLLIKRGLDRYRRVRWYLLAMIVASAVIAFVLQPIMGELREDALTQGAPVMLSVHAHTFKQLHGLSSILYLTQTLIGLLMLWRVSRPIDQPS